MLSHPFIHTLSLTHTLIHILTPTLTPYHKAGLEVGQGVELPTETSAPDHTDDQCGQAATLTFYMQLLGT
jgi:hypothetical protein